MEPEETHASPATPSENPAADRWKSMNPWGIFMVIMGGWWLLGEVGLVPFSWAYIGPLALIIVGIGMLMGHRRS